MKPLLETFFSEFNQTFKSEKISFKVVGISLPPQGRRVVGAGRYLTHQGHSAGCVSAVAGVLVDGGCGLPPLKNLVGLNAPCTRMVFYGTGRERRGSCL